MGSDPEGDEFAAFLRQSWADDLKTLAAVADSSTADPAVRKDAQDEPQDRFSSTHEKPGRGWGRLCYREPPLFTS